MSEGQRLDAEAVPMGAIVRARCGCIYRRERGNNDYPWFRFLWPSDDCGASTARRMADGDTWFNGEWAHERALGGLGWSFDKDEFLPLPGYTGPTVEYILDGLRRYVREIRDRHPGATWVSARYTKAGSHFHVTWDGQRQRDWNGAAYSGCSRCREEDE